MMNEAYSPFSPTHRNISLNRDQSRGKWLKQGSYFLMLIALSRLHKVKQVEQVRKRILTLFQKNLESLQLLGSRLLPSMTRGITSNTDGVNDMENYRLIRSVLMFWFGQYQPDDAQKKLWMIAASSECRRHSVDAEITERFERIIIEEIYHIWTKENYGYQGKLAAIIVLDQFSRHIHRYYGDHKKVSSLPDQSDLDNAAYKISKDFVLCHQQEIECGMIPLPMIIFSFMPYRHASTIDSLGFVQRKVEHLSSLGLQFDSMLSRFRKATNRRMAILQDESRRTGTSNNEFSDIDLLEACPFEADMALACDHVVYKTITEFLNSRGKIIPGTSLPVIVSLSGGVDSMVIASVLAHLAKSCEYHISIWAVHIDYANRPESGHEADFVRRYCEANGIHFKLRRINEVTRGITARDDYERIAREARYNMYRETAQLCKDLTGNQSIEVGVMLGHHRGDLRENVLSNAHRGCGPLELSGMTQVSVNDRVFIYRPLLPLEKLDIFDYAHKYGIPYFKDTTPHWSTRGKIRNKLLPLLQEIYGEGSTNNLSNLAIESDQAKELLHSVVLTPFLDQVETFPMGLAFSTHCWKSHGQVFWKFVLRETLHRSSLAMFSDKSVEMFMQRINCQKLREGWLQCRRDYGVYLRDDGRVFVLFPSSFPFNKNDKFDCVGQVCEFGKEAKVGPWVVSSRVLSKVSSNNSDLLGKKSFLSWEDFMYGNLQYFLTVPISNETIQPLVFVSGFQKLDRPRAWKNCDLKIQTNLPILGNSMESVDALCLGSETALVEVTLSLNRK
jgi:tRNA(Ile)-lysidine synthetase-like protein